MRIAADTALTEEVAATAGAVLPEDTPETTQSLSDVLPAGDVVPEGQGYQFCTRTKSCYKSVPMGSWFSATKSCYKLVAAHPAP